MQVKHEYQLCTHKYSCEHTHALLTLKVKKAANFTCTANYHCLSSWKKHTNIHQKVLYIKKCLRLWILKIRWEMQNNLEVCLLLAVDLLPLLFNNLINVHHSPVNMPTACFLACLFLLIYVNPNVHIVCTCTSVLMCMHSSRALIHDIYPPRKSLPHYSRIFVMLPMSGTLILSLGVANTINFN